MPAVPIIRRTGTTPPASGTAHAAAERRRAWLLTLAYFCVVAFGTLHHEMWRDEWQAWMLARDSASVGELLRNIAPEGHPPAWYLLLYVVSRFTRDAAALQGLNVITATAAVFLIARFSRLPWLYRVLIAFGYFFIFEYGVISRAYSLTVLALFAVCALFTADRRWAVPLVFSLAVLATVSVYGLIIAIAISTALVYDRIGRRDIAQRLRELHVNWRVLFFGWLIAAAVSVVIMRPSDGFRGLVLPERFTPWTMAESAGTLTWGYTPVPDLREAHIWNTHILPQYGRSWIALRAGVSIVLLTASILLFARCPAVLILYVVATAGLGLFQHLFFPGTLRHHGHYFIIFVACLWLAHGTLRTWQVPRRIRRFAGIRRPAARAFVVALLVVQCIGGIILYVADLRQPFSAAPMTAQALVTNNLAALPLGVSPAPAGSAIAGILDRRVYFLAAELEGTFVPWARYQRAWDRDLDMRLIRKFIDAAPADDTVIVLTQPFEAWDPDLDVREIARHEPGLERREGYVIYTVTRGRPQ